MSRSIAFVQDHDVETLRVWNTDDTAESLKQQGLYCNSLSLKRDFEQLFYYDSVIFYRSLLGNYDDIVRNLKARNILVGFMIDDLLWDPRFSFAYHPLFDANIKKFFNYADYYVFTSDYLAAKAPQNKKIIIRKPALLERRFNYIRSVINKNPRTNEFRILITKGHTVPEFKISIKRILEKTNVNAKFYYFSDGEKTYPNVINKIACQQMNFMRFDDYLTKIATINPDLILVPLEDTEFNRCKCYPKYLEAGAMGSCLLASSIYPYKKVIVDGKNGLLANSIDEFSLKIDWAIRNRDKIREIGMNAMNDVHTNHLLNPIAKTFFDDVGKLLPKATKKQTQLEKMISPTVFIRQTPQWKRRRR